MAERDDRMAQNARDAQNGQASGGQGDTGASQSGEEPTDTLTDRNLSGASTWATLGEENSSTSGGSQSDRDSQGDSGSSGGSSSGGMR